MTIELFEYEEPIYPEITPVEDFWEEVMSRNIWNIDESENLFDPETFQSEYQPEEPIYWP